MKGMRMKVVEKLALLAMLCGGVLAGGVSGQDALTVAYYPSPGVMTVRVAPRGLVALETARLRTPQGEPGLLGEYFDLSPHKDAILAWPRIEGEPVYVRTESRVDFAWDNGSPTAALPNDWYAARWTGTMGPFDQPVRLATVSDDGVRLWLDGELVIDDWTGHPPKLNTANLPLEAGRVAEIRLEYFEAVAGAMCKLGYRLPDDVADAVRSAEIRLLAPDGKALLAKTMTWEGECGELQVEVPPLAEGVYTLEARLPGVKAPVTRTIMRKRFPWEGNRLGITDKVLPPFTPITVKGKRVGVVLRTHTVGGLGLWDSVLATGNVSAGGPAELLAGPMTLVANGTDTILGSGRFRKKAAHEVVYEGQAEHPAVAVHVRTVTEYDGCMRVELTLSPPESGGWNNFIDKVRDKVRDKGPASRGAQRHEVGTLNSLWLDIPLRAEHAPLFHATTTNLRMNPSGAVPPGEGVVWDSKGFEAVEGNSRLNGQWFGNFKPYLWVGAEERGLAWFADNDAGWVLDLDAESPAAAVACQELIRDGERVILRLNLVQKPITLTEPRTIVFGLMASPAKPMPADWRTRPGEQLIYWMGAQYWGSDCGWIAKYPRRGDLSPLDMMKARRLGEPVDFDAFKKAFDERNFQPGMPIGEHQRSTLLYLFEPASSMAAGAGRDRRFSVYWEGFYMTNPLHDEWETFKHEWGATPASPSTGAISPSYRDFAVWWGAQFIRRGMGLYFDNACPIAEFNPLISNAYRLPNGHMQASAGIWARRDYLKRIWILHRTEADPRLPVGQVVHMTNTHIIPYLVWNDVNLDLEMGYYPRPMQDKFTAEFLRTQTIGRQSGAYPEAIANVSGWEPPEERPDAERQLELRRNHWLALTVHEIRAQPHHVSDICKILVDFGYGRDDCRVFNYWDKGFPLVGSDPAVKTLLLERNGELMIVFASWNPEAAKVSLTLDSAALGVDVKEALNAETGATVAFDGREIRLDLEGYEVGIVKVK